MPPPQPPHRPPTANLCIHFYTFGHYYARTPTPTHPLLMHVECKKLIAPPRNLCERYTGQDAILSDEFFSHRANETLYQDSIAFLRGEVNRLKNSGGCHAVTVSCQMGMHRSVAMAERLSRSVAGMGYKTSCNHIDLAQSKALRQGKLTDGVAKAKAAENRSKDKQKVTREKAEAGKLVKENSRLRRENGRLERENGALAREKERRMREWMVEQSEGREQIAAATAASRAQPKIQNAGDPIQYQGKPAPADAAAYRFEKPHGWVRAVALPV